MRQYAVIDARTKGTAKGVWVLSTHASREMAEARLRAYVQGILDGTRESAAAVGQYLPAGKSFVDLVPHLQVFGVSAKCERRTFYAGPLYSRRVKGATKKTA
jgi:hypothetical protein